MTQQIDVPKHHKYLTTKLLGGQQNYELFKTANELPPFNKTALYYSMLPEQRLANDVENLAALIKLCRNGIVKPDMLQYVAIRVFGPAYTLIVHYEYFGKLVLGHGSSQLLKKLSRAVSGLTTIGGVLNDVISLDLKEAKRPQLVKTPEGYKIQMHPDTYYFSETTNILIDSAVAYVVKDGDEVPVYVPLKCQNKNLLKNVTSKYIGDTISFEHTLIGYNLNGVIVPEENILIKNWNEDERIKIRTHWDFTLFGLSLVDLYKGCDLAIRYTNMRRQFQTIPESTQERRIGQYQAVASRLADGISMAFSMACLYGKLSSSFNKSQFSSYIQYTHHVILERLMHLRQCCGGYGYIKYSGLPQLIERVSYRASLNRRDATLPTDDVFLINFMYYSSTEKLFEQYADPKVVKSEFSYFGMIALRKRLWAYEQPKAVQQTYLFDFVKHSAIQALYSNERSNSHRLSESVLMLLVKYLACSTILENADWINWKFVQMKPEQFLSYLIEHKSNHLTWIGKNLMEFSRVFEFGDFPDVVAGREDSTGFYEEVLRLSKENRRNGQDFLEYVKKPMVDFLNENSKAKL